MQGVYDEHNTIMLDDLRRNYVCNKQVGGTWATATI
jgi:hypothetical protein